MLEGVHPSSVILSVYNVILKRCVTKSKNLILVPSFRPTWRNLPISTYFLRIIRIVIIKEMLEGVRLCSVIPTNVEESPYKHQTYCEAYEKSLYQHIAIWLSALGVNLQAFIYNLLTIFLLFVKILKNFLRLEWYEESN